MPEAVIVGASIAGLYTARQLARHGWKVRIIERRPAIGLPVRCGEATGNRAELARFVELDDSWIASDIRGLAVHVNNDLAMTREIPDTGVMLKRDVFEQRLAEQAVDAGAELLVSTTAVAYERLAHSRARTHLDTGAILDSDVLIGADGAECGVGQWAGICGALSLRESFSAAQYRLSSDFCNDGLLHFFTGSDLIRNGYIWVFPKGNGEISVGAGLYGGAFESDCARVVLDRFIDSHIPGARREMLISGCAPVTVCPKKLWSGPVVLVGDSARQVNPLTAGGIMNTLEAADLLATRLCQSPDNISRALKRYSTEWRRRMRFEQKVFLVLQQVYLDSTDEQLRTLLRRAQTAMAAMTDRSKPFRWPVVTLAKLFWMLSGSVLRHITILAR